MRSGKPSTIVVNVAIQRSLYGVFGDTLAVLMHVITYCWHFNKYKYSIKALRILISWK